MYVCVCVSGCPRSPFSPKLLDQILPNLTGGCSRTSRCALVQMILIWLALWPQKSNRQGNLWVNPHVGTGMDGWSASWNSHRWQALTAPPVGKCGNLWVQYPRAPPGVEEQHSISHTFTNTAGRQCPWTSCLNKGTASITMRKQGGKATFRNTLRTFKTGVVNLLRLHHRERQCRSDEKEKKRNTGRGLMPRCSWSVSRGTGRQDSVITYNH